MRGLDWLLLAAPASWALWVLHGPPLAVFGVSALAIVPLAAIMGRSTEALASRTGPALGGVLTASFGNAAELILALAALRAGLLDLVKASVTGSILGNLLLILGLALTVGGLRRPILTFNRTAAGAGGAMLLLAVVGLVFPALFAASHPAATVASSVHLSEGVALVLGLTYGLGLVFSLVTHRRLFQSASSAKAHAGDGVGRSIAILAGATAVVAVQSEILVGSIESVVAQVGLSETFLGLIVIPLIGNAAENAGAVVVARRGKPTWRSPSRWDRARRWRCSSPPCWSVPGYCWGSRCTWYSRRSRW